MRRLVDWLKEESQQKKNTKRSVLQSHTCKSLFILMLKFFTILNNTMYVKLTSEMLINPASLREETTFSRGLRPPVEPGIE